MEMLNLLTGGALENLSVMGLGIFPYLSASGLVTILLPLIPGLERHMAEDRFLARDLQKNASLVLTIPIAFLSAWGLLGAIPGFEHLAGPSGSILGTADWSRLITTLTVMTAGTFFAVWLAELLDAFAVFGMGTALLQFSGLPGLILRDMLNITESSGRTLSLAVYLLAFVGWILIIVWTSMVRRIIPVYFPGRPTMKSGISMPVKGTIPLLVKLDYDPAESTQALLVLPGLLAGLLLTLHVDWIQPFAQNILGFLSGESLGFWLLFFIGVVGFTIIHADMNFEGKQYGVIMRQKGIQIPGVLPGAPTQRYLAGIVRRISILPALVLGLLVIFPWLLRQLLGLEVSVLTGAMLIFLVSIIRDCYLSLRADAILSGYDV
jgi:preprotein translocase subunit SecY